MSKISLEPNASGAGTFTLAAPNSNTNRTLTLPDEDGTLISDGGVLFVDSANNRVGVGTSSPSSPVTINHTGSDGDVVSFEKDGSTVGSIGVDSNGLIQDGNRTDFPSFTRRDKKSFFISDIREFDEVRGSSSDNGICLVCPKFLDDFFSVSGSLDNSSRMAVVINVRSDYQNTRADRGLVYFGIDATFLPGLNDSGDGKVNPEIIISRYHVKGNTNAFSNGLVEVDFNGIPWLGIEEGIRGAAMGNGDEGFWIVRYDISTTIDDTANPEAILSDIRSDFIVHRNQLEKTSIKNVGDVNIADNTGAF